MSEDDTKRARVAYEAFRGGLLPMDCDVPRWEDAPSWIRDVALVAYLQGKLDAPKESRAVPQISGVWHPIETAPKDGTPVLLGFPDYLHAMHGHCEDGIWGQLDSDFGFEHLPTQPTHWMPLPTPPETTP